MADLTMRGELGTWLRIAVRSSAREEELDPYVANCLHCSAEVEQGGFRGAVDASFERSDFARFLSELDQIMTGSGTVASFNTMEEVLAFRVDVNHLGHVSVTGRLRDTGMLATELSFVFDSNRSFLKAIHSDLKRLVATFPERVPGTTRRKSE